MFIVLKPFVTVNRRFLPEGGPVSPADLDGTPVPLADLLAGGWLAPADATGLDRAPAQPAAAADAGGATGPDAAETGADVKPRRKTT